MSSFNIWEIWKRADTGPICPSNKFLLNVAYPRLKELVKEYGIYQDPEVIVPTDDTLIDDVFRAGVRCLLDVGVLCVDTERIIQFEDWEVKEAIRKAPREVNLGEGRDTVKIRPRRLEDTNKAPVLSRFNGPASSESISFKVYLSMAKEPLIDMINTQANLKFIDGMPVKAGAPTELYCEIRNAQLGRETIRRAGRPGMPLLRGTAATATADIAASSEHGYRRCDMGNLSMLPGLHTNYMMLNKAAHYLEYGCSSYSLASWEVDSAPETYLVGSMAAHLASLLIYKADVGWSRGLGRRKRVGRRGGRPFETLTMTSRDGLWGTLMLGAACSKNRLIHMGPGTTLTAGCCSEMILFEIANATIGSNAVGSQIGQGMGHITRYEDYISGLEGRFTGEVNNASVGIKREDANDLIRQILKKYEYKIENRKIDLGKKFQECYDLDTITPGKEYLELYDGVKLELKEFGLEFE